jgi:hypothetical protein
MNKDEETGLRAFALTVGSDPANPPQPAWIERGATRIAVTSVDAQWREEERLGFRVRLTDDTSWLLYYVPDLDLWSGIGDRPVEEPEAVGPSVAAGETAKTP